MKGLEITRKAFVDELEQFGDWWRICRTTTMADLIRLHYAYFVTNDDKIQLVYVFNYCMKFRLLKVLAPVDVQGSMEALDRQLGVENGRILELYDSICREIITDKEDGAISVSELPVLINSLSAPCLPEVQDFATGEIMNLSQSFLETADFPNSTFMHVSLV
jgi:hypothetical protein